MLSRDAELKKYYDENNMEMLRARAIFDIIKHIEYYSSTEPEIEEYYCGYDNCKTKEDIIKYIQKFDLTIDY